MPRYVALLRGVSPLNAKMPELKRSFEAAGFRGVRTVLSSGNVVFDAPLSEERALERRAEAAMAATLGRSFHTIVRTSSRLAELLAFDPYTSHGIPRDAKRVVSFLREARPPRLPLPLAQDHACVGTAARGFSTRRCSPPGRRARFPCTWSSCRRRSRAWS